MAVCAQIPLSTNHDEQTPGIVVLFLLYYYLQDGVTASYLRGRTVRTREYGCAPGGPL